MAIAVFDWGGTSVKVGLWEAETLQGGVSFATPGSWTQMKDEMAKVIKGYRESGTEINGVAISSPGAVNTQTGVIEGISAIPYIHHFEIQKELSAYFNCPVAIENDANCAGIAEVWRGAAKDYQNVLFVVLGTGVGGAIIQNGQVMKGSHLYGGEFGLMFVTETNTFSEVGTAVKMAERYCKRKDIPSGSVSGAEIFELATTGDSLAQEEVEKFYNYLTKALFSLQFTTDPEVIVIGGGISAKAGLAEELNQRLAALFKKYELKDFLPKIVTCVYQNEANLIGAVANYMQQNP